MGGLLYLAFFLENRQEKVEQASKYKMTSDVVGDGLTRLENFEVVCYVSGVGGVSCWKKETGK